MQVVCQKCGLRDVKYKSGNVANNEVVFLKRGHSVERKEGRTFCVLPPLKDKGALSHFLIVAKVRL